MPIPFLALAVIAILFIDWRVSLGYLMVLFIFMSYQFTPDTYWILQYQDLLPFLFLGIAIVRRLVINDR